MAIIKVVCGIIFKKDKVLICRRSEHKSMAGFWEFPGGKIESGEQASDALIRELQEELGMKVIVGAHFKTVRYPYENFTIELISYTCQFQEATYKLIDHDEYEWIELIDLNYKNLAPADIPIAEELIRNRKTTIK